MPSMTLVRFPAGDALMVGRAFEEPLFAELDSLLLRGQCPEGWLEVEVSDTRLVCLLHQSRPFIAGLVEPGRFGQVPLHDLVLRIRGMEGAVCSLYQADAVRVLLVAVHFCKRPVLQSSTRFVDLVHVLDVLAAEGHDAALALERSSGRTLVFLRKGSPARIYFGPGAKDPGGDSIENRFLLYGFAPDAPEGRLEVFESLTIEPDIDAGKTFRELAREAEPPPAMNIRVMLNQELELQRGFMPPSMSVGRDQTCELILADPSVSRRHCRLSWSRGKFWVEDLESVNGTSINGKRVRKAAIAAGDRVGAGIYEIELVPHSAQPDLKATMMVVPDEAHRRVYLAGAEKSVPLDGEITIGSSHRASLPASGFFVRKLHARVRVEGSGVIRLTCHGRATVSHNGRKVRTAFLRPGDEIVVGRTRYELVSVPEPLRP